MKVVTLVVAALAAVFAVAGVLVGWVLPLVDGRTARFAIERADAQIDVALRFKQYGVTYDYYEMLWAGEAWVNIATTLLVMGGLLAALAVVGVVLLAKEKKQVAVAA